MSIYLKSYILKSIRQNKKRALLTCLVSSVLLLMASLFAGTSDINAKEIISFIAGNPVKNSTANIIIYARLPRIISSYLCGMALALSGLLLQAALNNPLASPGIIGVNSGAGFFVVSASVIFPSSFSVRFSAAFLGALLTAFLIFGIAKKTGGSRTSICRFEAMGFAAMLAASAVCIGGLISFVGLIVPHIVRNIAG